MPDELSSKMFLTAAVLGVITLFLSRYFRRDPQVRSQRHSLISYVTISLNDFTRSQLDAIPTVGFSDPILSYFSALRFIFDGDRMLKEGCEKVMPFLIYTLPQT